MMPVTQTSGEDQQEKLADYPGQEVVPVGSQFPIETDIAAP